MPEETTTAATTTAATETTQATTAATTPILGQQAATTTLTAEKPWIDESGKFSEGWPTKLSDELGESRLGLGKFKDVNALAKAHLELERTLGHKANQVVVPGKDAKPEDIAKYRKQIGVPDTLEAYDFKPEKMPDGTEWNGEVAKPFAKWAFDNNVPPAKMKELAAMHFDHMAMIPKAQEAVVQQQQEAVIAELRKEWGESFDRNTSRAAQAVKLAGIDPNVDPAAFDNPHVIRAFAALADKMGEDNFVNRDGTPLMQDAYSQANDIMTNPANPHFADYQGTNGPARQKTAAAMVARGLQSRKAA